jgi:serine/threonine protein kinase
MQNDGTLAGAPPKPEEKEQGTVASVAPPKEEAKEASSETPKSTPPPESPKSTNIPNRMTSTGRVQKMNIDPDYVFGSGAQVGEYIAEEKIGEGGMGEVWRGLHPVIGKRVAIKLLNKDFIANKEVVARFVQEARAVNAIKHRGLVDIFSFGDLPDGRPYFVMEFLDGKPLSKYIKTRGPLPFSEIVDLFGQACRALQAAHDNGIIHRDLKPDNLYLILEEGAPPFLKVLDFGIAKLAGTGGGPEGQHLTKTGAIFGTPAYMSPEQCEGAKAVDTRSDLYALGIILFEMITGRTPFSEPGEGIGTIMMKQMSLPAPAPSSMVEGREVPASVDDMVLRVLSKNPDDRPSKCTELAEEFKKAVGSFKTEELEAVKGAKPVFGPKQNVGEQIKRAQTGANAVVTTDTTNKSRPSDYFAGSQTSDNLIPVAPSRKGPIIGIAAAGVIAVVVGIFAFGGDKEKNKTIDPKPEVAAITTPPPPETKPVVEVKQPEPVKTPAKPEKIKFKIATEDGAKIYINGNSMGSTPLPKDFMIAYSESPVELRIEKDGFETFSAQITPNEDILENYPLTKKGKIADNSKTPKNPKDPGKVDPVKPDPGKVDPVKPDPGKVDPVKPDPGKTTDPDSTLNPFKKKTPTP